MTQTELRDACARHNLEPFEQEDGAIRFELVPADQHTVKINWQNEPQPQAKHHLFCSLKHWLQNYKLTLANET